MLSVQVHNFEQWRNQARQLLLAGVLPAQVEWLDESQPTLFVTHQELPAPRQPPVELKISARFLRAAERAACHRDASKWALLYHLAWRLVHQQRDLLNVSTDAQVSRLRSMSRAVGRDIHKMKAFVRFSRPQSSGDLPGEHFFAWYEPKHLITEAIALFFVERFTGMNWSILTPDKCLHWDQRHLKVTEGVNKPANLGDALEDFWRTYYTSIFNPARVKVAAMKAEMPVYYWKNLPEAQLITGLLWQAPERVQQMINRAPSDSDRLRDKSAGLRARQDRLRVDGQQQP